MVVNQVSYVSILTVNIKSNHSDPNMQENNNLPMRRKYFKFDQSNYNLINSIFFIIFQQMGTKHFKFDLWDNNFNVY